MIYLRQILTVFLIIILLASKLHAQTANQYNLNTDNGLPSNHVYSTLVDRHGYLWACTDKGVVRYNGYGVKIFNHADGISKDDIWRLFEDSRGRIWLLSISDELGYLYNNKYYKVFNKTPATLYPKDITEYDSCIVFTSPYVGGKGMSICVVKNDTVYIQSSYPVRSYPLITKERNFFFTSEDAIYTCYLDIPASRLDKKLLWKQAIIKDEFTYKKGAVCYAYNHYIFSYGTINSYLSVFDLHNCSFKKMRGCDFLKNDTTIFQLYDTYNEIATALKCLLVSSNNHIYLLDSNLKLYSRLAIDSISKPGLSGNDINYVIDNRLWQQCVSTTNNGIFINYHVPERFRKANDYDLTKYKFIGQVADSISYWWNAEKRTMAVFYNNRRPIYKKYSGSFLPNKIIQFNTDSAILFCNAELFWFNVHSHSIISIIGGHKLGYWSANDAYIQSPTNLYVLSITDGLAHATLSADTLNETVLSNDRYNGMFYYPDKKLFCLFKDDKIIFHKVDGATWTIEKGTLAQLGINSIDNILFDKTYKNVFIKTASKLFVLNVDQMSIDTIMDDLTLDGASIFLHKNKLITVGNFGIAGCDITGPMRLSKPVIFFNTRGKLYRDIKDVSISDKNILLKTDAGIYITDMPVNTTNYYLSNKPKLILNYNKNIFSLYTNDTIFIDQNDLNLYFDCINPFANGNIRFRYNLANNTNDWNDLASNEMNLSQLKAGNYYPLTIQAFDNTQHINTTICLFIVPKWWQTTKWKVIFFIGAFIILGLLFVVVSIVTRRIVVRNTTKKNKQLELELRSIYSQINPHFIFNTLNSGLSFIKMKELDNAYNHISRFSSLLRGYLKSSRSRFITIEEEITNLRNYIELQQTRFKGKFDYEIRIDSNIAIETTKMPSMLLQPLVENAIVHGLTNRRETGKLKIDLRLSDSGKEIIFIIDDDGIGREKVRLLNNESSVKRESFGSSLIADLIQILNNHDNMNISIQYIDKQLPETGTIVRLQMNI